MKCLSVRQPWADLLCGAHTVRQPDGSTWSKTVEGRTWGTGYRGPLVIHASRTVDQVAARVLGHVGQLGVLIGVVDLVDCVRGTPALDRCCIPPELLDLYADDGEPWVAWVRGPNVGLVQPVAVRGALGLFEIADGLVVPR